MRIAICEDSQLDRELLVGVVDHYAAQRGRSIQVTAYGGGLGLIHDVEDGEHFDLAFLDNLMDDILGIEVARRLRELDFRGPLVFISSTDAYAVAGYQVAAAAYLLKPYDYETVAEVLDKFLPEGGLELCRPPPFRRGPAALSGHFICGKPERKVRVPLPGRPDPRGL